MKKSALVIAVTAILFAGWSFTTVAEDGATDGGDGAHHGKKPRHHGEMIKKMDKDGDGIITRDEHRQFSDEMFTRMDKDGDGKVSREEAKKHFVKMRKKMMKHRNNHMDRMDGAGKTHGGSGDHGDEHGKTDGDS